MKSIMMHIVFICHEYPPCNHGGIGSFTKDLAEGLVQSGFNVSVIGVYSSAVLEINEQVEEEISGVKVYRLPEKKSYNLPQLNNLANRWHLYTQIKKVHSDKKIDILESPESQGWLPMGTPKCIPFITRFHGGETYFGEALDRGYSRLNKILEKRQLVHSDQLVSVSNYTAKKTLDIFRLNKPYTVIYNSVKVPEKFKIVDENSFVKHRIVFTGSVIPKKGVYELVKAMNIIFARYPDAELYLAGKNNYKVHNTFFSDILLGSLEKESYKPRVKFLGSVDREKALFPLLSSAEVCCFPSYSEAFALTPLESMAIGKPVVFSKLTSGPEAIEDGISGLLCNPKDPKDIAEKIMYFFKNPGKAKEIAENGKKRVETLFSYDKWIKENIALYQKGLDEN